MNVEIGTETPIFLFWEYLFRNFSVLSLQCAGQGAMMNNPLAKCWEVTYCVPKDGAVISNCEG